MARERDDLSGLWTAFLRARLDARRGPGETRLAAPATGPGTAPAESVAPVAPAESESSPASEPES